MMPEENRRTGRYWLTVAAMVLLAAGLAVAGRLGQPNTVLAAEEAPQLAAEAVPDSMAESVGETAEDATVEGEPGAGETPQVPDQGSTPPDAQGANPAPPASPMAEDK
jgi:hypothetical protein